MQLSLCNTFLCLAAEGSQLLQAMRVQQMASSSSEVQTFAL